MRINNSEIRTICVQGFCKLLYNKILDNKNILAMLIIEFFSPISSENEESHDCLSSFFPAYGEFPSNFENLYQSLILAVKAIERDRRTKNAVIGKIKLHEIFVYFIEKFSDSDIYSRDKRQTSLSLELLEILMESPIEFVCL